MIILDNPLFGEIMIPILYPQVTPYGIFGNVPLLPEEDVLSVTGEV